MQQVCNECARILSCIQNFPFIIFFQYWYWRTNTWRKYESIKDETKVWSYQYSYDCINNNLILMYQEKVLPGFCKCAKSKDCQIIRHTHTHTHTHTHSLTYALMCGTRADLMIDMARYSFPDHRARLRGLTSRIVLASSSSPLDALGLNALLLSPFTPPANPPPPSYPAHPSSPPPYPSSPSSLITLPSLDPSSSSSSSLPPTRSLDQLPL